MACANFRFNYFHAIGLWSFAVLMAVIYFIVSKVTDDYDAMMSLAVLGVIPSLIVASLVTLVVFIDRKFDGLVTSSTGLAPPPKGPYQSM